MKKKVLCFHLVKPTLRKLEIKNHCHEGRKTIIVGCQVNGSPAPVTTWFVNGTKIDQSEEAVNHGHLFISKKFKYKITEIKGVHSNIFSKLEIQVSFFCLLLLLVIKLFDFLLDNLF